MSQYGATRLRYSATTLAAAHATWRAMHATGACVAIQTLDCDRGGLRHGVRNRARHGLRHDQCALRHGWRRATIRRQCAPQHGVVRTAWAQCVHSVRSLGHGCVHCTLDPVLTRCTVLSHYFDHCSEPLFGSLFTIFSKNKIKLNFVCCI